MAFLLPNLSPSLLINSKSSKDKEKPILHQTQSLHARYQTTPTATATKTTNTDTSMSPPLQVKTPPAAQDKEQHHGDEFYVNLGLAVRTLREDLPLLFTENLNYDIYRDDITFIDPLNTFTGIDSYKLIFWALTFHGKMLFREISLEVYRIWQPSENVILIRWNLKGVPRVPWEAKGEFQGTSRYKLDRNGKIYEHKVDNLAFSFPQTLKPAASVLDLVAACPASPNPTFLWGPVDICSSSWVEFYRAVRETLDQEQCQSLLQDGMITYSLLVRYNTIVVVFRHGFRDCTQLFPYFKVKVERRRMELIEDFENAGPFNVFSRAVTDIYSRCSIEYSFSKSLHDAMNGKIKDL